jgi:hypothetical protein
LAKRKRNQNETSQSVAVVEGAKVAVGDAPAENTKLLNGQIRKVAVKVLTRPYHRLAGCTGWSPLSKGRRRLHWRGPLSQGECGSERKTE